MQTAFLLNGLLLPEELSQPWVNCVRTDPDYFQEVYLVHPDFGMKWEGVVIVFTESRRRMFIEILPSGLMRKCPAIETEVVFGHCALTRWQIASTNKSRSLLQLYEGDVFYGFDPTKHEVEVLTREQTWSRVYARDFQRRLSTMVPLSLPTYVFMTKSKLYMCNVQGRHPTCMVLHTAQDSLKLEMHRVYVRERDKYQFSFTETSVKLPDMIEAERSAFSNALAQYALSGWKTSGDNKQLFGEEDNFTFVNNRCRLHNQSVLGARILQYVQLSNFPRSMRNAIAKVKIDLLYSELVCTRFRLVVEEFTRRGIPHDAIVAFHGVRAAEVDLALKDITDYGFSTKHAQYDLYGAGGIYCTQQFACAMQYVKHPIGKGLNHVFVCLALPGNWRKDGRPGERMQPNQQSWFAASQDIWPFTYWVIGEQALLPIMLIQLE